MEEQPANNLRIDEFESMESEQSSVTTFRIERPFQKFLRLTYGVTDSEGSSVQPRTSSSSSERTSPSSRRRSINPSESKARKRSSSFSGLPSNSRNFITRSQLDSNLDTLKSFNHELNRRLSSLSVSDRPVVFELNAETTQNDVPCERSKSRLNLEVQNFIPSVTPNLERQKFHEEENEENLRKSLKPKKISENDKNVISTEKQKQNMENRSRPYVSFVPKFLPKEHKLKSFNKSFIFILLSICTIFVLLISVFVYANQNLKHSNAFANIAVESYQWIYGQDESIHTLCKYLQSDMPSRRVIAFIGDTGIGKSYTVEIIKKIFVRTFAFNHQYLAREYALRQCFSPIGIVKKSDVPLSHSNLIIMENLREHKLTDVISFLNELQDLYENRPSTVLAIFNITEMDDVYEPSTYIFESIDLIENSLIKIRTYVKIIPYYYLNKDVLTKCIMDAEKANKLTFTKKQFSHIKLLRNNMPCKRVYGKVRAIGRTILRNSS